MTEGIFPQVMDFFFSCVSPLPATRLARLATWGQCPNPMSRQMGSTGRSDKGLTLRFQTTLFMLYIYVEQWGFHCSMCQNIMKVPPVHDVLDRHVQVSITWRPLPQSYTHVVYFTCYFYYMFSLGLRSPQEVLVVFGCIEVSYERYTPNIYRYIHT